MENVIRKKITMLIPAMWKWLQTLTAIEEC